MHVREIINEEYLNHKADIIVFGSTPFPEIQNQILDFVEVRISVEMYIIQNLNQKHCLKNHVVSHSHGIGIFFLDYLRNNKLTFPENVLLGKILCLCLNGQWRKCPPIEDKLHFYQYL